MSSPYPDYIREMIQPSRPLSNVLFRLTGHNMGLREADAKEFYEYYKNDPDMQATDAFMCHFPSSFCEIYLQFNRSVILSASHRIFIGRCSPTESNMLIQHLRTMWAQTRRHFIFGSNRYDAEYIRHYTGLYVPVLPCSSYGYQKAAYAPHRPEILLGPLQLTEHGFLNEINAASQGRWIFKTTKKIYPRFSAQVILYFRLRCTS